MFMVFIIAAATFNGNGYPVRPGNEINTLSTVDSMTLWIKDAGDLASKHMKIAVVEELSSSAVKEVGG